MPAQWLEQQVWEKVRDSLSNPDTLRAALDEYIQKLEARRDEIEPLIKPIEQQLKENEGKRSRLAESYVIGNLKPERASQLLREAEEKRDRLLSMKQEVDPRQIEELERTKSWLRFWKDTQKELSLGLSMIPDEDGEELPDQRQLIERSFQGVWNIAEIDKPELEGKLGFPTSKRQLLDYFQTEISVHKDYVELKGIIPLDGIIPIEARKNTVLTRDQEGASSAPGHRQILPGCHR